MRRKEKSLEKMPDGPKQDKVIDDIGETEDFVRKLVKEADEVLRKELGLKTVNIKKPNKKNR